MSPPRYTLPEIARDQLRDLHQLTDAQVGALVRDQLTALARSSIRPRWATRLYRAADLLALSGFIAAFSVALIEIARARGGWWWVIALGVPGFIGWAQDAYRQLWRSR